MSLGTKGVEKDVGVWGVDSVRPLEVWMQFTLWLTDEGILTF